VKRTVKMFKGLATSGPTPDKNDKGSA
jgi:hypothetical protein